ncbi:hypothetical protein E8E11_002421 [Didymella keratinophila]|nr:hypothetical protein E8E11_002421 [Didymella keratinophila]
MPLAPFFVDAITHIHDHILPAFTALHASQDSTQASRTAFQVAKRTDQEFYTCLPSWLDVVAFDSEVAQDTGPEDVVFVDVGGGNGSQCAALRKRFPTLQGRIILQDRPAVLEKAKAIQGIENARAYYFRQILHNYNDDTCIQILQMHLPALLDNLLSRLYIDEKVLPDETSDLASTEEAASAEHNAALSLAMTAVFGAQERKEKKWRWLLDQAGMEVLDIRKFTDLGDSVIVAKRRHQDQWR